jgi:hypothetical protein
MYDKRLKYLEKRKYLGNEKTQSRARIEGSRLDRIN